MTYRVSSDPLATARHSFGCYLYLLLTEVLVLVGKGAVLGGLVCIGITRLDSPETVADPQQHAVSIHTYVCPNVYLHTIHGSVHTVMLFIYYFNQANLKFINK